MTTMTRTPAYTTCTGTRCYGLRIEGEPLSCPHCGGTSLLYPRKLKSALKRALLRQLPSGEIQALSSDGVTIYVVALGDCPSCSCPAGQSGRRCYHLASALSRYPAFYTAPWAVPGPDPEPLTPFTTGVHARRRTCDCTLGPAADCPCGRSLPAAA